MLQWQHLFPSVILKRGKEYYRQGRVQDLEEDDSGFSCVVEGSEDYWVEISLKGDRIREMTCDCPYAKDGSVCKHMAAALYEISEKEFSEMRGIHPIAEKKIPGTKPDERKEIEPFHTEEEDAFRYFLLNEITADCRFYEDSFQEARELADSGKLENYLFETEYLYPGDSVRGFVSATHRDRGMVRLTLSSRRIETVSCSCPACPGHGLGTIGASYPKKELCVHACALLILTDRYLKNNNVGDRTDYIGEKMLRSYRAEITEGKGEAGEAHKVCVEPRIRRNWEALELTFRVGLPGKMYVVKNLRDLVDSVDRGEEYRLGSKLTLDFGADRIGEDSLPYYALIERYTKDGLIWCNAANVPSGMTAIPLVGSMLDELFDCACGTKLPFASNQGKDGCLFLGEKELRPELELKELVDRKGRLGGVELEGQAPRLLNGAKYHYCFDEAEPSLYRIPEENYAALRPLLAGRVGDRIDACFGYNALTEFYQDILPRLKKVAQIKDRTTRIEGLIPAAAEMRFYLDAVNGIPRCSAQTVYGEQSFSTMDCILENASVDRIRNVRRERAVMDTVTTYFPVVCDDMTGMETEPEEEAIYTAITEGTDRLLELGTVLSTAAFDAIRKKRTVHLSVGVSVNTDLMDLTITSEGVTLEELAEILQSYRKKKKYHRLGDGQFVDLNETIAEINALMEDLKLTPWEMIRGHMEVPAYRALYLDKLLEENEGIYADRDKSFRTLVKDFKAVKDSDFEAPEELRGVLRSYQHYGHKWIRTLASCGFGGILADDMGLGKTLQMISVLLAEQEEGKVGTSLIVCPASLVCNWEEEFRKFAPTLRTCAVTGNTQARAAILNRWAGWDVLITSYDLLKRDIPLYEDKYFLYTVLDEAQYIKNNSSSAAKSVKVLRSKHRFAMTGTPIENRLSELWSIFDFLMPGFLYGYDVFRTEYELPIAKRQDEELTGRLRRMVSPFLLRRMKNEVLKDLPEKTEELRVIPLEEKQQLLYDAQVAHMKQMLAEDETSDAGRNRIRIFAELTKIRQICCDPSLLYENYDGGSAKREACLELVSDAIENGHRILLFSQFTSMLELLKRDLETRGIEYYEITGATPKQERLDRVHDFNEGTVPLFLISLKAGGTGLNLTGADMVIHYDPWWNAAAQNQATDRAHRIGQHRPVTVYKLIAQNSVEEKIQKMQEMKQNLANEILTGEGTSLGSMSKEELLALLECGRG